MTQVDSCGVPISSTRAAGNPFYSAPIDSCGVPMSPTRFASNPQNYRDKFVDVEPPTPRTLLSEAELIKAGAIFPSAPKLPDLPDLTPGIRRDPSDDGWHINSGWENPANPLNLSTSQAHEAPVEQKLIIQKALETWERISNFKYGGLESKSSDSGDFFSNSSSLSSSRSYTPLGQGLSGYKPASEYGLGPGIARKPDYLGGLIERVRAPGFGDSENADHINFEYGVSGVKKPLSNTHIPLFEEREEEELDPLAAGARKAINKLFGRG